MLALSRRLACPAAHRIASCSASMLRMHAAPPTWRNRLHFSSAAPQPPASDTPPSPPSPLPTPDQPARRPPPVVKKSKLDIAPTTLLVSLSLSLVSIGSLSAAALAGVDFNELVRVACERIPFLPSIELDPVAGTLTAIFIVHKLLAPARYALVAALLPVALPIYRRRVKPWWAARREQAADRKLAKFNSKPSNSSKL